MNKNKEIIENGKMLKIFIKYRKISVISTIDIDGNLSMSIKYLDRH